jgi:hypothetical protein
MNNLPVPCARPWAATAITNQRDTVSVIVGTGGKTRYFDLHVDALRQQSTFFRNALTPLTNAYIKCPYIRLTLAASKPFEVLSTWLYRGTLDSQDESKLSYLLLAQLYKFATRFSIPQMRNKVIDVFVRKMEKDAPKLPYDVMTYIEENMRDSALTEMLLDIMLECGDKDKLMEWKVNLAKGFWVKGGNDVAEGGVMPFGRALDTKGYIVGLRGKLCEKYHEHAERDDMVGDRAQGWFFDPPLT